MVLALVAGVATALFPLALGAMHTAGENASSPTDGPRDVGFAVAGVGFALSPLVTHAVLGEWERAAAFSAVPVASEIAIATQFTVQPQTVFHGTVGSRTTFALLFSADVLGAAVSLVDVMMVGERAGKRRARTGTLWPLPRIVLGPGGGRALVLGGTL